MKNLILSIGIVFLTISCAQFRNAPTTDQVKTTISSLQNVCEFMHVLNAVGAEIPGVEECGRIIPALNSDEVDAIVNVMECSELHGMKSKKFALCAVENGWDPLQKKLHEILDKERQGN